MVRDSGSFLRVIDDTFGKGDNSLRRRCMHARKHTHTALEGGYTYKPNGKQIDVTRI